MKYDFLPLGFEELETKKAYTRLSQFRDGENRIRIVMRPIAGWLDWNGNKPVRTRPNEKPKASVNPDKPLKAFWTMYIWDYQLEKLFVLEITQGGVLKALTTLAKDQDWGDLTGYDLKIKKEGSGKDTRYTVTPLPHKDLAPNVLESLKASPVYLEALYEGKDPWEMAHQNPEPTNFSDLTIEGMAKILEDHIDAPMKQHIGSYLKDIEPKIKQPLNTLLKGWLQDPAPFLDHYKLWLSKKGLAEIKAAG